jgi:hypothetical protein
MKGAYVTVAVFSALALIASTTFAKSSGGRSGGGARSGGSTHSAGKGHSSSSMHSRTGTAPTGNHHSANPEPVASPAPGPRSMPLIHSGRGMGCPADYIRKDNHCHPLPPTEISH